MVQFLAKVVDNQGCAKKMREKWCRNGAILVPYRGARFQVAFAPCGGMLLELAGGDARATS